MKYCKDCKWSEAHKDYEGDIDYWCTHPNIFHIEEHEIYGKRRVRNDGVESWSCWDVRKKNCKGEWWEETHSKKISRTLSLKGFFS